jgi:hypothetical protein
MSSYTSKSIDVDEFTYDHPDFLFIAGAGNSGNTGYNSITSPANSKNAIAVGASSVNHNNIVYFSSLGSSYDTAIKPNIITPGRYLQSAGVRMKNQTTSCNVEISSGTSMATPITAGAAILIRHYLENSSYWGKFCNPEYKSCPNIVPLSSSSSSSSTSSSSSSTSTSSSSTSTSGEGNNGFISSSLLRAVLIHSGVPMNLYESTSTNMLPEINLTSPPNNYEGWGQLRLSNVLPIPNKYNFDLYLQDYISITSLTCHTYYLTIFNSSQSLIITIAWIDPPNINWGTKNLLNDLDLILINPLNEEIYGNNIPYDEYNTQEKVVIMFPMIGEYKILIQSKIFLSQYLIQNYSIVITSNGSINENKFHSNLIQDTSSSSSCSDTDDNDNKNKKTIILFQLEDWYAGESYENNSISLLVIDQKTGILFAECQFLSNEIQKKAEFTKTSQCQFCLNIKTLYTTQLSIGQSVVTTPPPAAAAAIPSVIRAVSPQCNVYLSSFTQSNSLEINDNGDCNLCSSNGFLIVTMYANVTDDDESQYSWFVHNPPSALLTFLVYFPPSSPSFDPFFFVSFHLLLLLSLLPSLFPSPSHQLTLISLQGMALHLIRFNIKIKHSLLRVPLPFLMNNLIGMNLLLSPSLSLSRPQLFSSSPSLLSFSLSPPSCGKILCREKRNLYLELQRHSSLFQISQTWQSCHDTS